MSRYEVIILEPAAKTLETMRDRKLRARLTAAIDALQVEPRPPGSLKMSGMYDKYRIRVGNWRIIYTIADEQLIIAVIKVGPRKDVYR